MATRPVFTPIQEYPFVEEKFLEFQWFPGFSKAQAQKSIRSLHKAARQEGIDPVLEISSKSPLTMGVELSAFNLMIVFENCSKMSVECAFQGSKIFENGGPYQDLYQASSIEAKKDERLRASGDVVGFKLFNESFPTEPKTSFYDWLYLKALSQNPIYSKLLLKFQGFSDIAFNPKKSINCQAKSAALFVSLSQKGYVKDSIHDWSVYFSIITNHQKEVQEKMNKADQYKLPMDFFDGDVS